MSGWSYIWDDEGCLYITELKNTWKAKYCIFNWIWVGHQDEMLI